MIYPYHFTTVSSFNHLKLTANDKKGEPFDNFFQYNYIPNIKSTH